jgi:DNA-binding winged helix-turn-helix (wHTH) protein
MRVSFGDCVLDMERRELVRAGEEVHLTPKALELLGLLAAQRPRAVAKSEIHDRLWPGTSVTESNLTTLVTELRKALGDAARRPRYVKTVQRFGYAFCGAATELSAGRPRPRRQGPRFKLEWAGGEAVTLHEGENLIGREEGAVAWIESAGVSRRHARIVISDGRATLEDLGSRNGTVLRGQKVTSPMVLLADEEIRVGPVPLRFRIFEAAATTQAAVEE